MSWKDGFWIVAIIAIGGVLSFHGSCSYGGGRYHHADAYVDDHYDDFEPPHGDESDEWDARGYPCTDDCSGHRAGYEWAEQRGIDDPDDCGGNSQSFTEGCMAYTEGQ